MMRFSEICREAGRDVASGTARASILAVVVAVCCCGLTWTDVTQMTAAVQRAAEYRRRGASISILEVPTGIDGRACDALADQPGVRASGALRESQTPFTVAVAPQNPLTHFEATPGFRHIFPNARRVGDVGVLLPGSVVESLGLGRDGSIVTTNGHALVAGFYDYPDDGRPRGFGYAALSLAAPTELFDQCWVDAYPLPQATRDLIYTAIAADAPQQDGGPKLTQHNTTLGMSENPAAQFTGRMSAGFPLIGLAAGFTLACLAVTLRRLEVASALHVGVPKTAVAATMLLETVAWAVPGVLAALPGIAWLTRDLTAGDHQAVVLTACLIPALTASGALLGTVTSALLIREKRLFAYFKGR